MWQESRAGYRVSVSTCLSRWKPDYALAFTSPREAGRSQRTEKGTQHLDDLGTWFPQPASSGLQLPTPLVLVSQMPLLDSSETCTHATHARMCTQIKSNKQIKIKRLFLTKFYVIFYCRFIVRKWCEHTVSWESGKGDRVIQAVSFLIVSKHMQSAWKWQPFFFCT